MKVSADGIALVEHFEGCRLTAYLDPVGIPTVGFGHTGPDVKMGMTITASQAQEWLEDDLGQAEALIDAHVLPQLSQGEFDALASLLFNVGPGRKGGRDGIVVLKSGKPSTLLTYLNQCKYEAAADQFLLWSRAGGVTLKGLVLRRRAERAMFLGDDWRSEL